MIRILIGLLGLSLIASADTDGPDAVAVQFLKKLEEQDIIPNEETALADGITPEKLKSIIRRLDRIGSELRGHELRVVAEKTDGDLAGVIVAQMADFDPSRIRLHAVALIKRDGEWLPAPMPASYENTGISYFPDMAGRARELERWMLAERAKRYDGIKDDLNLEIQTKISKALDKEKLKDTDPSNVVNDFMAAWKGRNYHAALGYLGGLEKPLPEDWSETVSMVAYELENQHRKGPEETPLGSNDVISTTVHTATTDKQTVVSIGSYLLNKPRNRSEEMFIRHFILTKSPEGLWRIHLPAWLTGKGRDDPRTFSREGDGELIRGLPLRLFNDRKREKFDDAGKLGRLYLSDLSGDDFAKLLGYIHVDNEEEAQEALESHAKQWRIARRTPLIRIVIDTHVVGDDACVLYCELDPYKPELNSDIIRPLRLVKTKDYGWQVHMDASPQIDEFPEEITGWIEASRKKDRAEWLPQLGLNDRLGGIAADSAPEQEAIDEFAETWRTALESRQPHHIFKNATLFDDEDGIQLLFKYLGQELPSQSKLEIIGTHRNGRWGAVSIRHYSNVDGEKPIDLLHPIVSTPDGPKCLPEAVLYVSDTRAREILNSVVWRRLGKRLPEDAIEELKKIHEDHNALSEKGKEDAPQD